MPSLRALECLVAVADSGSITQAARMLHSSQPAVSHQLAALERETRTPLLRREPRGVKLTPAGRVAIVDARRAIDAAASAVRSARSAGEATGGSLRLACAQSLTVSVLAPIIREWHRRRPQVTITLRESAALEEMLGFIDADEVDFVLMPGPVPERYFSTPVAEEEIVLTAPTRHRLAQKSTVRLEDLDGEPIVRFAPENGLSVWLDRALTDAGVRPETVMRTSVTVAAPQLAAAGLGVAVTPLSAISAGLPGAVRSFSPRWARQLVAVSPGELHPLSARLVDNLRARGVRVPRDIRVQLTAPNASAPSQGSTRRQS